MNLTARGHMSALFDVANGATNRADARKLAEAGITADMARKALDTMGTLMWSVDRGHMDMYRWASDDGARFRTHQLHLVGVSADGATLYVKGALDTPCYGKLYKLSFAELLDVRGEHKMGDNLVKQVVAMCA